MKEWLRCYYWSCVNQMRRFGLPLLFSPVLGPLALIQILLYVIRYNTLPRSHLHRANSCFISPFVCFLNAKNVRLGEQVGLAHHCYVWAGKTATISIGDHTLVGPGAMIVATDHRSDGSFTPIRIQGAMESSIQIGRNVWIGHNATVLKGVSIGDNAVIGAGAVVTHDVPAGAVVVGVPAKAMEHR